MSDGTVLTNAQSRILYVCVYRALYTRSLSLLYLSEQFADPKASYSMGREATVV